MLKRTIGDREHHHQIARGHLQPDANVDAPLRHAGLVAPDPIVGHVGAAAFEMRELGVDVHGRELGLPVVTFGAEPRGGIVDAKTEGAEVSRLREEVACEIIGLAALEPLVRDEKRSTAPRVAMCRLNVRPSSGPVGAVQVPYGRPAVIIRPSCVTRLSGPLGNHHTP